jgi:O-antigen/teichoic acid export membrane protein
MSLAKKAVHGMAWVALSTIIVRTLRFGTQIVLARLLDPSDFGLLAIGLLAINSMGLFRELGFGAALIYKKEDSNYTAANTAFLLLPVVASALFALAYMSAPYIASFFNNATVEPIIRILSLTFVISSFGTVPSMLLEKELEFKKKVLPETVPIAGYACVAIGLALLGYGVWSMVYGQIVSAVLMAVLIWMVSNWRPTFSFDRAVARELFAYGKHILGASVVAFIITNIDNAIIGKMLGMSALGFYAIAYTISNLPATQITHLVSRVAFPTYSKLQDDRDALKHAYLKTLKYVSMLSIPAAFGIFMIAPDFVSVVLGEKWMPAVVPIQILSIFGLSSSIVANNGSLRNSLGRPDIAVKLTLLRIAIFIIIFYPLTAHKGIAGMCLAVLISAVIPHTGSFVINQLLFDIKLVDVIKSIYLFFLNSVLMVFVMYITQILTTSSFKTLVLLIIIGLITYISLTYIMSKNTIIELCQIIGIKK